MFTDRPGRSLYLPMLPMRTNDADCPSDKRFPLMPIFIRFVLLAGATLLIPRLAVAEPSKLDPRLGYNYGEMETPRGF